MFNPNVNPVDTDGRPVSVGLYRVADRRTERSAEVFEDVEATLWVLFDGAERPQRLDELSQFLEWMRIDANGASRSAGALEKRGGSHEVAGSGSSSDE